MPQRAQSIHATRSLDKSTVDAARQWKITPEYVGGHGVAGSIEVGVCYTVTTAWPPDFDCAWTPTGTKSKIRSGSGFALAPVAKLSTDVIGRTL